MLPNVGLGEFGLIFLVLLLAVGPSRLPEIARALGKAYQTFQRETTKAKDAFKEVFDEPTGELRDMIGELRGTRDDVAKTIADSKEKVMGAGVIDRPDEVVEADPHAQLTRDRTDGPAVEIVEHPANPVEPTNPVEHHTDPVEHPTNAVVRDYEDT